MVYKPIKVKLHLSDSSKISSMIWTSYGIIIPKNEFITSKEIVYTTPGKKSIIVYLIGKNGQYTNIVVKDLEIKDTLYTTNLKFTNIDKYTDVDEINGILNTNLLKVPTHLQDSVKNLQIKLGLKLSGNQLTQSRSLFFVGLGLQALGSAIAISGGLSNRSSKNTTSYANQSIFFGGVIATIGTLFQLSTFYKIGEAGNKLNYVANKF